MMQSTQARSATEGDCGPGSRARSSRVRMTANRGMLLLALWSGNSGWAQTVSFLGQVAPLPGTVADVISPATGEMLSARQRPFTVGDRVEKGQALLVLTNRYNMHDSAHLSTVRWSLLEPMFEARYAALEARIAREKVERLKGVGAVSGQQLAVLKAAEEVSQAAYLRRKVMLDQQDEQIQGTTLERRGLMAPIDGQISLANFAQGQLVNEGFLLYRIVDLRQVAVSARVPESSFHAWPPGTVARIRFDDLPGREFAGRLEVILPAVDPLSRVRAILFRVENPDEVLRFGMVGHVEVILP